MNKMNMQQKVNKIEKLIDESNTIGIVPSKMSGIDAFCAGVALYHMLKAKDKKPILIYPGKTPENTHDIINNAEIVKDLRQRSLIVSIDYNGTNASNVHYSTENNTLHIKIQPVPQDFDREQRIKAKVFGHDFDLLFVLGAQSTNDIGTIYENLDSITRSSKIINVDNVGGNEKFGFINVINNDTASLSLLIFQKMNDWGLLPNVKSAKALLKGISSKDLSYKG